MVVLQSCLSNEKREWCTFTTPLKPNHVLVLKPNHVLVLKPNHVLVMKPNHVLVLKPNHVLVLLYLAFF